MALTDLVAAEIRAMMARRQVTGLRLAKLLGVSNTWVSYRLNAKVAIDLNDLERIAAALDVHVQDLLPPRDELEDRRRRSQSYVDIRPAAAAVSPSRRAGFTRPGDPWPAAA